MKNGWIFPWQNVSSPEGISIIYIQNIPLNPIKPHVSSPGRVSASSQSEAVAIRQVNNSILHTQYTSQTETQADILRRGKPCVLRPSWVPWASLGPDHGRSKAFPPVQPSNSRKWWSHVVSSPMKPCFLEAVEYELGIKMDNIYIYIHMIRYRHQRTSD